MQPTNMDIPYRMTDRDTLFRLPHGEEVSLVELLAVIKLLHYIYPRALDDEKIGIMDAINNFLEYQSEQINKQAGSRKAAENEIDIQRRASRDRILKDRLTTKFK